MYTCFAFGINRGAAFFRQRGHWASRPPGKTALIRESLGAFRLDNNKRLRIVSSDDAGPLCGQGRLLATLVMRACYMASSLLLLDQETQLVTRNPRDAGLLCGK